MRKLHIRMDEYSGCCAAVILTGFPNSEVDDTSDGVEIPIKKALTDAEWFFILEEVACPTLRRTTPLVTFANSSGHNTGACTPAKLAEWLRKKGEIVHTGASAVNPSTNNTVTIYTWAPSEAFKKKFDYYKKKKQDADNRGARTA